MHLVVLNTHVQIASFRVFIDDSYYYKYVNVVIVSSMLSADYSKYLV